MDTSIADVLVHIDELLSREDLAKLEAAVRENDCVVCASVPAGKMHMMLVLYNPDCTTAKDILIKMKEQGVHAELVEGV